MTLPRRGSSATAALHSGDALPAELAYPRTLGRPPVQRATEPTTLSAKLDDDHASVAFVVVVSALWAPERLERKLEMRTSLRLTFPLLLLSLSNLVYDERRQHVMTSSTPA